MRMTAVLDILWYLEASESLENHKNLQEGDLGIIANFFENFFYSNEDYSFNLLDRK